MAGVELEVGRCERGEANVRDRGVIEPAQQIGLMVVVLTRGDLLQGAGLVAVEERVADEVRGGEAALSEDARDPIAVVDDRAWREEPTTFLTVPFGAMSRWASSSEQWRQTYLFSAMRALVPTAWQRGQV